MASETEKHRNNQIDFIGVGAAKSGTTWLSAMLDAHPDIDVSKEKELFFFSTDNYGTPIAKKSHYSKGLDWYFAQFPKPQPNIVRGEFSTNYLIDPNACARIQEAFPETKILVCLRNPIEKYKSLYWWYHSKITVETPDTIQDAINEKWLFDRGYYFKNLKKYIDAFKKENVHVVLFDDIKSNPTKVLKDTYKFLKVDPNFVPENIDEKINKTYTHKNHCVKKHLESLAQKMRNSNNTILIKITQSQTLAKIYLSLNAKKHTHPPLTSEHKVILMNEYIEDIVKLEGLIERDLSSWKNIP